MMFTVVIVKTKKNSNLFIKERIIVVTKLKILMSVLFLSFVWSAHAGQYGSMTTNEALPWLEALTSESKQLIFRPRAFRGQSEIKFNKHLFRRN